MINKMFNILSFNNNKYTPKLIIQYFFIQKIYFNQLFFKKNSIPRGFNGTRLKW